MLINKKQNNKKVFVYNRQYNTFGQWINKLYEQINLDKRIVIPVNSAIIAETLYEKIRQDYPDLKNKCMMYSGAININQKELDI